MNLNTISDRELVAAIAGRLAFVRSDLEVAEADATKAERERDEARAEVERLRLAASDIATDLAYEEVVTIPEADEEIERLMDNETMLLSDVKRYENEAHRLREALREIAEGTLRPAHAVAADALRDAPSTQTGHSAVESVAAVEPAGQDGQGELDGVPLEGGEDVVSGPLGGRDGAPAVVPELDPPAGEAVDGEVGGVGSGDLVDGEVHGGRSSHALGDVDGEVSR